MVFFKINYIKKDEEIGLLICSRHCEGDEEKIFLKGLSYPLAKIRDDL